MSNQETIENLWEKKDEINFIENIEARNAVLEVLDNLDKGKLRVCEKIHGNWDVNQWLKEGLDKERKPEELKRLRDYYVANVCSTTREPFAAMKAELAAYNINLYFN